MLGVACGPTGGRTVDRPAVCIFIYNSMPKQAMWVAVVACRPECAVRHAWNMRCTSARTRRAAGDRAAVDAASITPRLQAPSARPVPRPERRRACYCFHDCVPRTGPNRRDYPSTAKHRWASLGPYRSDELQFDSSHHPTARREEPRVSIGPSACCLASFFKAATAVEEIKEAEIPLIAVCGRNTRATRSLHAAMDGAIKLPTPRFGRM